MAAELGPDRIVVVIICDSGDRYLSKCYNDEWMKDMGYLVPDYGLGPGTVADLLAFKNGGVEFADPDEPLAAVARRMAELGFSQLPLRPAATDNNNNNNNNPQPLLMVHEGDVLQSLLNGICSAEDSVVKAATPLKGQVGLDDPLARVQTVFDSDHVAVAVDDGEVKGVISKIDLIEYLAARERA